MKDFYKTFYVCYIKEHTVLKKIYNDVSAVPYNSVYAHCPTSTTAGQVKEFLEKYKIWVLK